MQSDPNRKLIPLHAVFFVLGLIRFDTAENAAQMAIGIVLVLVTTIALALIASRWLNDPQNGWTR